MERTTEGEYIHAKVKIDVADLHKSQVVIRKTSVNADGMVLEKYGLSVHGEWIEIAELGEYPKECYLPVEVYTK